MCVKLTSFEGLVFDLTFEGCTLQEIAKQTPRIERLLDGLNSQGYYGLDRASYDLTRYVRNRLSLETAVTRVMDDYGVTDLELGAE